jgi:hypothetical protein
MKLKSIILIGFVFSMFNVVNGQKPIHDNISQALKGFITPQDSTRTKVWWFHGETETTRFGITADLEALKRAGIGGVVFYNQKFGKDESSLPGLSSGWWEMLKFAAKEAQRVGLTFETHVSNGYVAGGPWIKYENAMKRLVASEHLVEGGRALKLVLSVPNSRYNYHKDIAVLAFPAPIGGGVSSDTQKPELSSNIQGIDLTALFNPGAAMVKIPTQPFGKSVYINLEFPGKFSARSITYQVKAKGKATTSATYVPAPPGSVFVGTGYRVLPMIGQLEVSQDGKNYVKVCDLGPIYIAHESWNQKTIAFPVTEGKYFRLNLHDWAETKDVDPDMQLSNVVINSDARVDQWEEKAALYSEYIENDRTPLYKGNEVIQPEKVIDLTSKMDANDILNWDAPKGSWIVMRFAQVATGGSLKHGLTNLMGLECDKLSAKAAEIQFNNYFKRILDTLRSVNVPLSGMVIDSHEAGSQNWTDNFLTEFQNRRGYSLLPYLPVLWGRVMASPVQSSAVLYDVRRTIADLISDNYYGTFEKLCAKEGTLLTAQAIGNALCIVGDPIQAKSKVAKPQGEFWIIHPDGNYDIKESSSAAHLYGKYIASAEAYTGALYSHTMADLKGIADGAYTYGINEFVVCASAYQPWGDDRLPGNVGGGWQWVVNRNNTWWNYSNDFWDYQSRCAYLLRKGRPIVDLCVYLGDNAPVKILSYRLPDIPSGYYFDAFTQDALLTRMQAVDGMVGLPDGIKYSMMTLPRSGEISLKALRKIAELVRKGIKVWGTRPTGSPSKEDIGSEIEYQKLVNAMWNTSEKGVKTYGNGKVYWGMSLQEALQKEGLIPDIQIDKGNLKEDKLFYVHRMLNDADLYFINNHKTTEQGGTFTFRTKRSYMQRWNPMTGKRYALPIIKRDANTVTVNLKFAAQESYFVVGNDKNESLDSISFEKPIKELILNDDWMVYFSERMGGPGKVHFDKLEDWTQNKEIGIRYYSGTAVYTRNVNLERLSMNDKVSLDLKLANGASEVIAVKLIFLSLTFTI